MERIRVLIGSFLFVGAALSVTLLSGCADESRQTGTQVVEDAKQKAVVDTMRNDMGKGRDTSK